MTQPAPIANAHPPIWRDVVDTLTSDGDALSLILARDIEARAAKGLETYGVDLQPFNGRDAVQDAYEEALDAMMYTWQAACEADGWWLSLRIMFTYWLAKCLARRLAKLRLRPGGVWRTLRAERQRCVHEQGLAEVRTLLDEHEERRKRARTLKHEH